MPYVRVDSETFDDEFEPDDVREEAGERPSGGFEYESAEGSFKPERLSRQARFVYDSLRARGIVRFRVRYDGGYDEGFSHPDACTSADGTDRTFESVAADLAKDASLLASLRSVEEKDDSMWGGAVELYRKASDERTVRYALDELAQEISSRLLGQGFGTGEYELYGALTADLITGEIVDDESAEKPLDRM